MRSLEGLLDKHLFKALDLFCNPRNVLTFPVAAQACGVANIRISVNPYVWKS
ncbi:MAG: hypothetical protein ACE5GN_03080 [Waddliaceae bacterium]